MTIGNAKSYFNWGMFFVFILFFCLATSPALALEITLEGKILLLNSGGKPVEGARVSAIGAEAVVTDAQGLFQLKFPDKKAGDQVVLDVEKDGLMIINTDALGVVLDFKPVELVLAKTETFVENVRKYNELVGKTIMAHFKTLPKDAQKEGKDPTAAEMKDIALGWLNTLAESLAKTNLDDVSDSYPGALEKFRADKMDEALKIADDPEVQNKILNALQIKRRAELEIKKLTRNYLLAARVAIASLRFDKADYYYRKSVTVDPTDYDTLQEYARFLTGQKKYTESLPVYRKALAVCGNDAQRGHIINNMSNVLWTLKKPKEALAYCKSALNTRRRLAEANPKIYKLFLAGNLNNMGLFYKGLDRLDEALDHYKEAQSIFEELAKEKPDVYLDFVAASNNTRGLIYNYMGKQKEALESCGKALAIREKLAAKNPGRYNLEVCTTLISFAVIYKKNRTDNPGYAAKALEVLNRAEGILKKSPGSAKAMRFRSHVATLRKAFEQGKPQKK
ncbi:MAG: tetratricopeptide repeat protein [bacterium]|nr:tetratricopeptide repeat protein [bacterium]